ncbi:unnamed protein product [Alternaria alternata]
MVRAQQPIDGPVDSYAVDKREQTGLLTRFVPDKLKNTSFYRWLLRLTRVLQLVSVKTRRGVNGAYGAVEGILAAAVLYTLITMLLSCIKKSANPGGRTLRWIWVLLDLLFVGAFIAVTVLTRPDGGLAGARHCYNPRRLANGTNPSTITGETASRDDSCNLPWGTVRSWPSSAPLSLLHAITASFHEIKDYRRSHRLEQEKAAQQHNEMGADGARY